MSRPYIHLHNHTEYSLLDGASKIERMVEKACECHMQAIGISDHGNMFGVPKFVLTAKKFGIKPVIGSEFYLAGKSRLEKMDRDKENEQQFAVNPTYHQILFAATLEGYHNLIKLSSLAFSEGYHYKPRIDRELLQKYSNGVMATTCCLASEVNQTLLKKGETEAEKVFRWYLDLFQDRYYIELQRHGLADQEKCNVVLQRWAAKYNVPILATNDVHYVDVADSEAHDLLLALQTNADIDDPKRFRFTDDQGKLNTNFYFKKPEEMAQLFDDLPDALENTLALADRCNVELKLNGDLLLPVYQVPVGFRDMDDYLRFLTYEGAKKLYGTISGELEERLETELRIIKKMGFAGYFLIVQDFTNEARKRGVLVGPGRGSAAGSVVAYCIGILGIDPLKYDLLFERFLNPERISPPDIDIDFDDEGRQEVINYVIERYGKQSVSQIITYGTMGPKTALRDVGRVLKVELSEVNKIAAYVPEKPGMTFQKALTQEENPDGYAALTEAFRSPNQRICKMMNLAQVLEGTTRHTGVHASAVIIAPGDITDYVPTAISNAKEKVITTQYDGPMCELVGLLKMDFLGLRTLSILKTAVKLIEQCGKGRIDLDRIPLDDPNTYKLYQNGETVATFQFESEGMQKYLRDLKPTNIEDLIAMNALYRPGPMDNIPSFIARKRGEEDIEYPHKSLEPILKNTYGIMVYQEQIMLTARVMAGYSLGQADLLRRAMGKKKKDVMEKERARFLEGAIANGIDPKVAGEVFDTMEKFAEYGFNKSHSAAYSLLAFRTAYLKANYPAEYMAAVLTHSLNDIEKVAFFINECKRMGIAVLPPSVNESDYGFTVMQDNQIRFGLGAIKNLGESTARAILEARKQPFTSIFDFVERIPKTVINVRGLEGLAFSGALDCLLPPGKDRSVLISQIEGESAKFLDKLLQYGAKQQTEKNSQQVSLFGGSQTHANPEAQPQLPTNIPELSLMDKLKAEKEVIGIYLSGHPLDRFQTEIQRFTNADLSELERYKDKEIRFAGVVKKAVEKHSQKGTRYGNYTLEDIHQKEISFSLFTEDFSKFNSFLKLDDAVLITAEYKQSYRGDYELKIRKVQALEGLTELFKELCIDLPLSAINDAFNQQLYQLLTLSPGPTPVRFKVIDPDTNDVITLKAGSVSILATMELLNQLKQFNISYELK